MQLIGTPPMTLLDFYSSCMEIFCLFVIAVSLLKLCRDLYFLVGQSDSQYLDERCSNLEKCIAEGKSYSLLLLIYDFFYFNRQTFTTKLLQIILFLLLVQIFWYFPLFTIISHLLFLYAFLIKFL